MDIDLLIEAGLTKVEAVIYSELYSLNETTIGNLIEKTGLHRGTVYNSINNLIKKGFVCFRNENKIKIYKTSGKEAFRNAIKEEKNRLMTLNEELCKEFEKVNKPLLEEKEDISILKGVPAFKAEFLKIYDDCKKLKCEYLFYGMGGEMQDATGEDFYKYTQKLKRKMRIHCRVILDKENTMHRYHKHVAGNIKYLSTKVYSPTNIWIWENNLLIVLFKSNPLTVIRIKNKSLADSYRNYFEYLWQVAEK